MDTTSIHPYFRDDERLSLADKELELKSSAASISTTNTAVESLGPENCSFTPGRSFFIGANGVRAIRLPFPSSQLEIPIYHSDGSLAYVSTREKKCSGNAVLSSPKLGDLVSTSYFFGPKRDPVIRLLQSPNSDPLQDEIKVTGKWTSRTQSFVAPNGSTFIWRYVRQKGTTSAWDCCDGTSRLLVLEKKTDEGPVTGPGQRIAQLVRNKHTRPKGTSKSTAGNGGELVLARDAKLVLDEALIVATCILMLKKEIDRRRALQFMIFCGIIVGN
ncbi:hypothetical protein VTO42DRAFT_7405 [Malbranchea cinnamomea]